MSIEVKTVADKKTPKSEVQSGNEAEGKKKKSTAKKNTATKKKTSRSKSFEENVIRDSETAKERGRKGGIKSGQVRREKMDAREAARYMLELASTGQIKNNLKELGVKKESQTNLVAVQARLFTLAMNGNLDAYRELMKMAGYEPEENRKERESIASDSRRDKEVEAKINALGGGVDGADVAINSTDEDGHNDVIVYIPKMMEEEECQSDENDENGKGKPDTTDSKTSDG